MRTLGEAEATHPESGEAEATHPGCDPLGSPSKVVGIYRLVMQEDEFFNSKVIKDLEKFKAMSDVIIANRFENTLEDVKEKVYTRNIFNSDS